LHVYDNLETPVQRADFWRYTKLYLDGGIYTDLEIRALDGFLVLLHSLPSEVDLLLFYETENTLYFQLRDWWGPPCSTYVRRPQIRNYIFGSKPKHPAMSETLNTILQRYQTKEYLLYNNRIKNTLMLTGPGAFTDSVKVFLHKNTTWVVGVKSGDFLFDHPGMNTWKDAADTETDCTLLWLLVTFASCTCIFTLLGLLGVVLYFGLNKGNKTHDA